MKAPQKLTGAQNLRTYYYFFLTQPKWLGFFSGSKSIWISGFISAMLSLLSDNSGSFQVVSKGRLVLLLTIQITWLPGHRHTHTGPTRPCAWSGNPESQRQLSDEVSGAPQSYQLGATAFNPHDHRHDRWPCWTSMSASVKLKLIFKGEQSSIAPMHPSQGLSNLDGKFKTPSPRSPKCKCPWG